MNDPSAGGPSSPAELARRVLKTLGERRIVPTPETFAEVYDEIAARRGPPRPAAVLKDVLRDVLRDLVRTQRLPVADAKAAMLQLQSGDWVGARDSVERALARRTGAAATGWPQTTIALLKQADALHANWTRARKLESVARVLDGTHEQPDVALERLNKLVESWGPAMAGLPAREESAAAAPAAPVFPPPPAAVLPVSQRYAELPAAAKLNAQATARIDSLTAAAEAWKQVALRAVRLVEQSCGSGSAAATKLHEYAALYAPAPIEEAEKIVPRFIDAVAAVDRQIDEQRRIREGLARLLGLLTANVQTLAPDETWLAGQLEPICALLGGTIDSQQIALAEGTVRNVIDRQSDARKSLLDAKLAMKELLATLFERIGAMGDSTGRYYEQVGAHQRELEHANDFATLSRVIRGLLADTQSVRVDVQRSRDELAAARREVENYEQRVRQLESELAQVETLVQKDPLTHALNRRGFEEAFRLETARALRYDAPLALAMLDLDNFKQLNDTYGHATGDRALVHLVQTLHALLRPTDLGARLGGEEFAVLFPATTVGEAVVAVERLQRELERRPLDAEPAPANKITLAFSAGVTAWHTGEALDAVLARADEAMYAAKRAGKNRVLKAV